MSIEVIAVSGTGTLQEVLNAVAEQIAKKAAESKEKSQEEVDKMEGFIALSAVTAFFNKDGLPTRCTIETTYRNRPAGFNVTTQRAEIKAADYANPDLYTDAVTNEVMRHKPEGVVQAFVKSERKREPTQE